MRTIRNKKYDKKTYIEESRKKRIDSPPQRHNICIQRGREGRDNNPFKNMMFGYYPLKEIRKYCSWHTELIINANLSCTCAIILMFYCKYM